MAALARCDRVGVGGPACGEGWVEVTATSLRQRRQKVLEGWGSTETPLAWVGEVGGLKDSGAVAATQLVLAVWQWLVCPWGTPMGACNGSSKTVKRIKKKKKKPHLRAAVLLRRIEPPPDTVSVQVNLDVLGLTTIAGLPIATQPPWHYTPRQWSLAASLRHHRPSRVRDNATTQLRGVRGNAATWRWRRIRRSDDHKDDDHDHGRSNGPGCGGTDDDCDDNGAAAGGIGGGDGDGGRDSECGDGDGDGEAGSGDADVDGDNGDRVATVVMRAWARTVGTQTGTTLLLVHILSYE
ncbi:hypothetical protein EDB83DRAFT_2326027 [Lactarius deliciosus]|nr:hypothetical protein EDB83DRAFT_2326027 [Lactarius deliciosus]